jgi:hypothetical protein
MTANATVKSGAPSAPKHPRYSLVVPVYNEEGNIASFCKVHSELPAGHEVLICHDFEGDDTPAALDRLPREEKPSFWALRRRWIGPEQQRRVLQDRQGNP